MIDLAFFGCWGESGHHLRDEKRAMLRAERVNLPGGELDGSRLVLPLGDVPGNGCCTYLPTYDLTDLAWWNRVFDARGAVNSHILFRGRHTADAVWAVFLARFPSLAKYHERPKILRETGTTVAELDENGQKAFEMREAWIYAYTSLGADRATAERMITAEVLAFIEIRAKQVLGEHSGDGS